MDTPAGGWSLLASVDTSSQLRTNVWLRTATGNDPTSYAVTQGSGGDCVVIIAAVSGASTATPRVAYAQGTGSQVVTPEVTLPAGTGTELRIGTGGQPTPNSGIWSAPGAFTPEGQGQ